MLKQKLTNIIQNAPLKNGNMRIVREVKFDSVNVLIRHFTRVRKILPPLSECLPMFANVRQCLLMSSNVRSCPLMSLSIFEVRQCPPMSANVS